MRALLGAPRAVVPAIGRLLRIAASALVVGIGVFAALLLVLRVAIFPNVQHYRDRITAAIAAEIHQPVAVDAIATEWDGWNPKLLISGLRVGGSQVRREPAAGAAPLLDLPRVAMTLSWTSVLLLEPRLQQLVLERPRLSVRRDAKGMLHIGGIEVDPSRDRDHDSFADWLLRQREIVVRDAEIVWKDDLRDAPSLPMSHVSLRLERRFGGHRFGLTGSPPDALAAPIDIRGDFSGESVREWQHATGEIYMRLDYADVAAWRAWLPLPIDVAEGRGALRGWFTFAQGELHEVVSDVELAGVRARLGSDLPELALSHVAGRVGWRGERPVREFFGRGLAFTTSAGQKFPPSDVSVRLRSDDEGRVQRGRVEFDHLQLSPLRELATQLPLPPRWRDGLVGFSPQGSVAHGLLTWEGPADAPTAFDARGEFANVGWLAREQWPGTAGLSGSFKANAKGGSVRLASRDVQVSLPHLLRDGVHLEMLNGETAWTVTADQLTLRATEVTFANADAAGRLDGVYRRSGKGPGNVDLGATLSRGNPEAVGRYLPVFLGEGLRQWVDHAIRGGFVQEAKLVLKGDLASFPFAQGKGGTFAVDVQARDLTLDYAERWPALTGVEAGIHFRDGGLRIDGRRGRVFGATINRAMVDIPDLRAPVLVIDGEASGPTGDFLRFANESPVREWMGDIARGAEASGEGKLALKLSLPLADREAYRVAGEFTLLNDQVKLPGVPPLARASGKVAFTQREVRARDLTAEVLGGPVRASVVIADGRTRIGASGTANLQALRREFPFPLSERTGGSADYTFALDARPEAATWTVESPLRGAVIDLPAPLGKAAAETRPLRVERKPIPGVRDQDQLVATLGDTARLVAQRSLKGENLRIDRVQVALGPASRAPLDPRNSGSGVWVRAVLPELDVDQWLALREPPGNDGAAGDLTFRAIDIDAGVLGAFGRDFRNIKVAARHVGDDWRLDLEAQEVAGTATWSAPGERSPNGRVVARLSRFSTPPAREGTSAASAAGESAAKWPELDVAAATFNSKGRDLGRMELLAKPQRGDWRIERLVLANDAGRIDASGAWRAGSKPEQTTLDVTLDARDGGAYLARFGHPGLVQGAPTKITGQLAWAGDPSDFDYPTLSGAFHLEVGSGRFMKVEPGIGKLLGVLSLQALPRRITLDFRDIFSEGFTFDRVTGNVRIAQGVMSSDDLRLVGSSAQIAITGQADLAQETQRLRVRVQPTLSAGVSAGAALMFLANPVVGAAIGAGSLLAQKVLKDPVEQIFSHEYAVTGTWSDPTVTRVPRAAPPGPTAESASK